MAFKRTAFTLVELVTAIVILAISSAIAIPVYINYRNQAQSSVEEQTVAAVREGIANQRGHGLVNGSNVFPATLDSAPANSTATGNSPFFATVLSTPIASGWKKGNSAFDYIGPTGSAYVYNPIDGTFGPTVDVDTGPSNVSSYTLAELLAMTPEQLAGLSLDEIQALDADQIAALSYKQFEAIATRLSPEQVPWARPEQIAMLSAETYGDLSEAQLNSMTQAQIEERAFAEQIRTLPYSDIRTLEVRAIKYLTTDQIASIPSNYHMGRIPSELRAAFTNDQIQAIDTANVSIGYLTADQREFLSTAQIEGLGSYNDIRHVPASRISEVTPALIASIPSSYTMGRIPADVRAGFTIDQIRAIDTGSISIGYLTADQRNDLSTAQIEGLGSYNDIRHVPSSRISEVTPALIASIPSSYTMGRIPADVRAGFTAEQVQSLNTGNVSIAYLSTDQRNQLTTAQIEGLGSYNDIRHVPGNRISEVSTSLVASIPSSYAMGRIPSEVRSQFTSSQVQALDTGNVSIGYLSTDQRAQLTTAQIAGLGTYSDIRHLSPDRVAEVSTDLIVSIPSSYAMGQISSEVRAGFTSAQVQAIDTSNVSISYLNSTQRSQLTSQQVASLGTTGDIRHLSSNRIAEVSTSLVAQIDSAYSFNQIATENVQAFTAEQVSAISGDFYDSISHRLTDEQRSWR